MRNRVWPRLWVCADPYEDGGKIGIDGPTFIRPQDASSSVDEIKISGFRHIHNAAAAWCGLNRTKPVSGSPVSGVG